MRKNIEEYNFKSCNQISKVKNSRHQFYKLLFIANYSLLSKLMTNNLDVWVVGVVWVASDSEMVVVVWVVDSIVTVDPIVTVVSEVVSWVVSTESSEALWDNLDGGAWATDGLDDLDGGLGGDNSNWSTDGWDDDGSGDNWGSSTFGTLNIGTESVFGISGVSHSADGTIGLNDGVTSLNSITIASLGGRLAVSGLSIVHIVGVAVLWVGVDGLGFWGNGDGLDWSNDGLVSSNNDGLVSKTGSVRVLGIWGDVGERLGSCGGSSQDCEESDDLHHFDRR